MTAAASKKGRVLLLTGAPGIGKTTVIRQLATAVERKSIGGFYTEEIRSRGQRQGFRLVTFAGQQAVITHVEFGGADRVGRYGVNVAAIDRLVETALVRGERVDVYLVDEIGRMECLSGRFIAAMCALFESETPIVATIAQKGNGFINEVTKPNGNKASFRASQRFWSKAQFAGNGMPLPRVAT